VGKDGPGHRSAAILGHEEEHVLPGIRELGNEYRVVRPRYLPSGPSGREVEIGQPLGQGVDGGKVIERCSPDDCAAHLARPASISNSLLTSVRLSPSSRTDVAMRQVPGVRP